MISRQITDLSETLIQSLGSKRPYIFHEFRENDSRFGKCTTYSQVSSCRTIRVPTLTQIVESRSKERIVLIYAITE